MKKHLCLLLTLVAFSFSYSAQGVVSIKNDKSASAKEIAPSKQEIEKAKAEFDKLTKKEKRVKKRKLKKQLKSYLKAARKSGSVSNTTLLAIIAIFIPPLAMGLYDGITSRFWLSLLLTILFFIPGLIYTLVVILGGK